MTAPVRLVAFVLALAVILAAFYGIGAATGIDGADTAPAHQEHTP